MKTLTEIINERERDFDGRFEALYTYNDQEEYTMYLNTCPKEITEHNRRTLTAVLEHLVARMEGEMFVRKPEDDSVEYGLAYTKNGLTVGQVAGELHNAALDTQISYLKEAIAVL